MANEQILKVSVKDIVADNAWNSRSAWETGSETREHSFKELVESIAAKGQQDPCDVLVKGKKYQLITGFRRFAAITQNGIGTVLVRVREMTAAEAALRNATENTERDGLRSADTCYSIARYLDLLPEADRLALGTEELGKRFGLSQSYMSKYTQVIAKVSPDIRAAWREGKPVPVSGFDKFPRQDKGIMDMLAIAKAPADQQSMVYNKLYGIGADGSPVTPDPGKKARKEAERVGTMLGRLALAEVISVNGDFKSDLDLFVPGVKGLAKSVRTDVAGALALSFQTAKTAPVKGEESDDASDE